MLIGLALPAALYGLLSVISMWIETGSAWARPFESDRMLMLSIAINLLPIRIYFVNWKMEKTGMGILVITFILVLLFFLFKSYL